VFEDIGSLNEMANTALNSYGSRNKERFMQLTASSDASTTSSSLSKTGSSPQDAMPRLLRAMESTRDNLLPSSKWLPPAPAPSLHTYHWHFNDFRIIVGSDQEVYAAEGHPAVSLRKHELGQQWAKCTAVDAYLDNIMSNIPELALSLELKGFVHGYKLMDTQSIPRVNTADTSSGPRLSLLDTPLFDVKDVEMNAAMLMRFLQANCKEDGATYFLQRERRHVDDSEDDNAGKSVDCVKLYDLTAMSSTPTKKWKWLLAMLSYRFANRLRQTSKEGINITKSTSFHDSVRTRERELLETCIGLLQELSDMGGNGHDMIRATAHDLIAESYLTVNPSRENHNNNNGSSSSNNGSSSNTNNSSNSNNNNNGSKSSEEKGMSLQENKKAVVPDVIVSPPISQHTPFALKRSSNGTSPLIESSKQQDMISNNGSTSSTPSTTSTTHRSRSGSHVPMHHSKPLLMGWPGKGREEEFAQVTIAMLEKAQQHLSKGLAIMDTMVAKEDQEAAEEDEEEEDEDDANDDEDEDDDDDIDTSVKSEARRLRLRKIDLSLVIASRQMISWRASSCMSSLREAARHLVPLVNSELKPQLQRQTQDEKEKEKKKLTMMMTMLNSAPDINNKKKIKKKKKKMKREAVFDAEPVRIALAWFWEIGGKLARALAADRYK
jgi:hypothetical protein